MDTDAIKRAIDLTYERKYDEAEKIYKSLLAENPNDVILLSAVGLFYVSTRKYEDAVNYLKQACDIKETLGTVSALGFAQYENKNYEEASLTLERALTFGENADIYNKLILSLFEIRNFKKAKAYTEKMCELYPDNPKTIANKIKSLTQTGELIEAEKICVEYLKQNPNSGPMWHHLGLLKELMYCDDKSAIECYKLAGENGNAATDYNIAVCFQKMGKYKEAEDYYKNFLKLFPNNEEAITSLGMCYLSQKKFCEGYELFYKRSKGSLDKYTSNLWKPSETPDKDLVIICDQGFGDHIQFIRYLPFFDCKSVKVAAAKSLIKLFKLNYPNYEFIKYSEINPEIQAVRVADLAYFLNMDFNNIPFSEGYLNVEPANITNKKLKVGLCWEAGAAGIRGMINRTINVRCFEPILNMKDIQVYSFQYNDVLKGNERYPQMINLAKDFNDFYDTAKALKSMDIMITVDTSVAHLAGALGVKTLLLLPYAPDWRWFRGCPEKEGEDITSWYKSVKLIVQQDHISWEEPINIVKQILNSIISSHKGL